MHRETIFCTVSDDCELPAFYPLNVHFHINPTRSYRARTGRSAAIKAVSHGPQRRLGFDLALYLIPTTDHQTAGLIQNYNYKNQKISSLRNLKIPLGKSALIHTILSRLTNAPFKES
jgi:hypothetical protein